MLACVLLAARLATDRPYAAALVGWNPLFAIHFAGGGHNDALMIALVLGALALAAARLRSLAALAWVAAVFVKWIPLLFFALRAVEARATGRRVSHRGFAVVAVVLVSSRDVALRLRLVPRLRPAGAERRGPDQLRALTSGRAARRSPWSRSRAVGIALAGGLVWLVREAARGRARLGLSACLLLATTPWLAPWYTIWALPLAAAEDDRRAQLISLGFCAYLLPQTIPL